MKALDDKLKRYSLIEAAKDEKKNQKLSATTTTNQLDGLKSFHPDAVWNELKSNENFVEEPLNSTFRIKELLLYQLKTGVVFQSSTTTMNSLIFQILLGF